MAIDTATNTVKQRIPIPAVGYGTTVTLDGKYVLVAMQSVGQMAVVDVKTLQVARTITVPKGIFEIVVNPNGKTAYASVPISNAIAVIDLTTFTTTNTIPAGVYTDGLAWAADPK